MRLLRWLIAAPFLVLLVLFALTNTTTLKLGLWPTDYTIEWPASAVILVAMAIAFLAGALLMWASELGQRRRARRAEHALQVLEEQVKGLKAAVAASGPAGDSRSTSP